MLGAIAEFETALRRERQMEGIARALALGTHFGREKQLKADKILELVEKRSQGVPMKVLMAEYKLARASIYRYLGEGKTLLVEDQQAAD
jgi:DNA invertase Pin-like site-specific DNA recombinase